MQWKGNVEELQKRKGKRGGKTRKYVVKRMEKDKKLSKTEEEDNAEEELE